MVGVRARTLQTFWMEWELVKSPTQSGSFKDFSKPSSPRLSYAVATGFERDAHARDTICQFADVWENMLTISPLFRPSSSKPAAMVWTRDRS